jgi:hypothetical protein
MENNCIINWELHQKLMNKKKTITVCTGIGSNMFFPEYVEIEISSGERDIITELPKDFKTPRKEKKISKEKWI